MKNKLLYIIILLATQAIQPMGVSKKIISYSKNKIAAAKDYMYKHPMIFLGIVTVKTAGSAVPMYAYFKSQEIEAAKATQLLLAENQKQAISLEQLRQRKVALQSILATTAALTGLALTYTYGYNMLQWIKDKITHTSEQTDFNHILVQSKTTDEAIQNLRQHGWTLKKINQHTDKFKDHTHFSKVELMKIFASL